VRDPLWDTEPVGGTGAGSGALSGSWPDRPLSAPVKLVIWDLDDTFWRGTLSEGPVALDSGRADLVRTLNRRGIVNAICSKNDLEPVRAELERFGLWEEFVFSRVDWTPKGPRVSGIIEDAQLRAANVLFLDDLASNLGEAEHFAPGLQTAGPELIDVLLDLPELAGKDDPELSRLRQYQVLERKLSDRGSTDGSNDEFLRSCDIRMQIHEDAAAQTDRLHELTLRTNQLNFTKRRPDREAFGAMLTDPSVASGYVEVTDHYGDYGICGFFALDRTTGTLSDYLFSCRILNMGIEQWLYAHLGRPGLEVVGDVASRLDDPATIDWITLDDGSSDAFRPTHDQHRGGRSGRILIVGGCDLSTTADFLGGDIATEFAHPGPTGAFVHAGHTETLRQSAEGLKAAQVALLDRLPIVDRDTFRSATVVNPDYDVLVLSVLTDYTQGLYRHRTTGLVVPWHQFNVDVTDPTIRGRLVQRHTRESLDDRWFAWFGEEFESLGGITPERFQENIAWLAGVIPDRSSLILVNGAEFPLDNPKEPDRHLHHKMMNAALDEVVATLPNARVCDVRTFIVGPDDFTDHLRHYRRRSYLTMAEEIRSAGAATLEVQPESWAARLYARTYRFAGRRKLDVGRVTGKARRASAGKG
jgi:FkbH-like protein